MGHDQGGHVRQVVLDTETTGLEPSEGHRIIEIGAVELLDRRLTGRRFHHYLNPEREVDAEALAVHGLSNDFLADKPRFVDLLDPLLEFIRDAELVIHNAEFDLAFLNHELARANPAAGVVEDYAAVLDSLALAREMHPGMKNSLDALCRRYEVDNSGRDLHGALLDANLLAEVYLRMTGGQTSLALEAGDGAEGEEGVALSLGQATTVRVVRASAEERRAHAERLARIDEKAAGGCLWLRTSGADGS